jgi:hypothetical protein
MQTHRGGPLSDADRADPDVAAYLAAMATVRRLEAELTDARAIADERAAAMDAGAGEARGRLGRVAATLGVEAQSLQNQRQRGKHSRRAPRGTIPRRILTPQEYEAALTRADTEASRQVPSPVLNAIVAGALASAGLLCPPPEPQGMDGQVCTAQVPDSEGEWRQCRLRPHAGDEHDAGGWQWTDSCPNAIPAR